MKPVGPAAVDGESIEPQRSVPNSTPTIAITATVAAGVPNGSAGSMGTFSPARLVIAAGERRKVNAVKGVANSRLSPVWTHVIKFEPPMAKGKNVVCQVVVDGVACGNLQKHPPPHNGTGSIIHYPKNQHSEVYTTVVKATSRSTIGQQKTGECLPRGSTRR